MNMKTFKTFLRLMKKRFRRNTSFHKICNTSNIEISYSYMRNIDSIIALHNKSFLRLKLETIYAIWYPFYDLKNVKNIHGRVILSVTFTCNFTKENSP